LTEHQSSPSTGSTGGCRATLRRWRTERDLTVRKLAYLIFQQTYVHDLETGKVIPTVEVAQRLEEVLQAGGELADGR